ncbi:uncharacterized protein LOC119161047 isoform X2 [Rhipicephalus microplus]|uniref:uncharacterized protein LOC119161047 isoform X2 n=1 Tax=Rhipicephalus microplus TaxID=6941 RepID=UPI003F6BECDF
MARTVTIFCERRTEGARDRGTNTRKTRVVGEAQPRKEQQQQQLKQETWELDPAGAPNQLNLFVSSAKPDEDAANNARIRKRFVEKLVRRSSAPTPSKPAEVTSAISALGRKISSKRDQTAPTTLDATVADVSRRKERSALLDLFPSRDSRRSAQKLRRDAQNETATEKRSGSGTTVPFAAIAPGASPAHPAAPPANKDNPKVPCDFLVERDEGAHAVVVKAEEPLVTVHSVSKRPKEREAHPSKTRNANGQKFPDKHDKSSVASSTAMDPQPAGSCEGSTVKRRTTRSGSHRRKKRAQEDLLAALNKGAAPLSEAPASVKEGASAAAAAPEGEVPAKEELPSATLPIDIRRPSILKLPRQSGTAVQASTDVRRRRSIVDFGLLTPKGLVEGDPPKTNLFADGATDGAPSEAGGAKPSSSITPAARKRRLSLNPRRFSSTSLVTASPCGPFMSASMTDSAFHGSDPMAQRKKAHNSMRTACLLTCSLVAVSASASSMITGAAKDALTSNLIVKKNLGGLVAWLVLVTPASILCATSCCAWLYFLHLSGRKAQSPAEMNEVCVTAATRLSKMGPINKNMLSFLSFLLVASSTLPVTIQRFWDEESRMLVWASVSRDMPWAVVIMNSTVQLATHVVENNNLVESGLDSLGVDFWTHNSPLANQLLLGAIGSVLAEVMDNKVLNFDLMPFVVKVAEMTAVQPWVYAVPAALGACTNMILPIHLPMIVIHEVVDVSMLQLVLIAVVAKTIIVLTSVFATNTYGGYLLDWAALRLNTTEPFE